MHEIIPDFRRKINFCGSVEFVVQFTITIKMLGYEIAFNSNAQNVTVLPM